jgi:hypothetical protein
MGQMRSVAIGINRSIASSRLRDVKPGRLAGLRLIAGGDAFEGAFASAVVEGSGDLVVLHDAIGARAVDAAAEGEDPGDLGLEDDVVLVDSSFDSAGLVGAFEVTLNLAALLLDLNLLG